MVAEDDFKAELDRLERLAIESTTEFHQLCRNLGFFLPLWAKARRRGDTLQIEWIVPRKNQNGQWQQRYLPKGRTAQYSASTLTQVIKKTRALSESQKTEAMQLVLAFEQRFAEIRSAASLLTEARRAQQRYQKQLTFLLEHNSHSEIFNF